MLPLQTLHNKRQTSVTASSAVSGRESERKKMERVQEEGVGGGWGGVENWVCHRAIPPLDMLPQKQMYGVNTAPITAPGRRMAAVVMRLVYTLPLSFPPGPTPGLEPP